MSGRHKIITGLAVWLPLCFAIISHQDQVIAAIAAFSEYFGVARLYDGGSPNLSCWLRFVGYSFTLRLDCDFPYDIVCAIFTYGDFLACDDTTLS